MPQSARGLARELLLSAAMKHLTAFALAALATTASACTDTTMVWGDWRDDISTAGSCHPGLFVDDAHVQIFDRQNLIASDDSSCDELGFSLEIPIDVTHVRVTAVDGWGAHWEKEFDVDGSLYVGVVWFEQDTQPD
jgi:hypothetical protein